MKIRTLTGQAIVLLLGLGLPLSALDLENMTDADRERLHSEIRAYLLENPEIIMEAVSVLESRSAEAQAQSDIDLVADNAEALFRDPNSWVGGNPEGDLVMVEFVDYRCTYCKRAHEEVAGLLKADGNIRFIMKEFPILGEESILASRFAIATRRVAGDAAYKAVHDSLITFNGAVNENSLKRLANVLGLDSTAILAEMESDAVNEVIAANHALGQRLQIQGTPAFVMGNQMIRGFLPKDAMMAMAEEIRSE